MRLGKRKLEKCGKRRARLVGTSKWLTLARTPRPRRLLRKGNSHDRRTGKEGWGSGGGNQEDVSLPTTKKAFVEKDQIAKGEAGCTYTTLTPPEQAMHAFRCAEC